MRVFLAGATGVIGRRLVPLLVAAGHEVAGMTRDARKAESLAAAGAVSVVCDVFDARALTEAVRGFAPGAVMHQLTDLPDDIQDLGSGTRNARMRIVGTANLLAAARAAGTARLLAQSIAWSAAGDGAIAVAELERAVLSADGVVLRYGRFYGPGTYYPSALPPAPRVQVAEAARRTLLALDAPSDVVTIVDAD